METNRILDYKSWRKKVWAVTVNCDTCFENHIKFLNRNAAVMWLKRYGWNFMTYKLNGKLVCVIDNYVYFYNPDYGLMISAESKRTHPYAVRNN